MALDFLTRYGGADYKLTAKEKGRQLMKMGEEALTVGGTVVAYKAVEARYGEDKLQLFKNKEKAGSGVPASLLGALAGYAVAFGTVNTPSVSAQTARVGEIAGNVATGLLAVYASGLGTKLGNKWKEKAAKKSDSSEGARFRRPTSNVSHLPQRPAAPYAGPTREEVAAQRAAVAGSGT